MSGFARILERYYLRPPGGGSRESIATGGCRSRNLKSRQALLEGPVTYSLPYTILPIFSLLLTTKASTGPARRPRPAGMATWKGQSEAEKRRRLRCLDTSTRIHSQRSATSSSRSYSVWVSPSYSTCSRRSSDRSENEKRRGRGDESKAERVDSSFSTFVINIYILFSNRRRDEGLES